MPPRRRARSLAAFWIAFTCFLAGLQVPPMGTASAVTTSTVIAHTPVASAFNGRPIEVTASTTCEADTDCPLSLTFRTTGGGSRPVGAWQRTAMTSTGTTTAPDGRTVHRWTATIPGTFVDTTGVDYYLESVSTSEVVRSPDGSVADEVPHYHVHVISPPLPTHVPNPFAVDNKPINVELNATCSTQQCTATLYYRTSPTDETIADEPLTDLPDWPTQAMTKTAATSLGDAGEALTFSGTIPASVVNTRGVDYFMLVEDGNTRGFWPGTSYQGYQPSDGVRTGYMHVHVLEAPHIVHAPVLTSDYRKPIPVSAQATCPEDRTCTATLYWRTSSDGMVVDEPGPAFDSTAMEVTDSGNTTGGQRQVILAAAIPGSAADTRGVDYFFSISDGNTTTWWPGTSQVDGYVAVPGTRVGYHHVRVLEPPHVVPTTPPAAKAGEPFKVTVAASCATGSCTAKLFYDQQDLVQRATLTPTTFTEVEMKRTDTALPTPMGDLTEYAATIPGDEVTTKGLVWYVEVSDGYSRAYAPGTSYAGATVAIEGDTITPDPPVGVIGFAGITTGETLAAAFPVRVLEPPHLLHTPAPVAKGQQLDLTATSNCSYPRCTARLRWIDADGHWQSSPMAGSKGSDGAAGEGLWSFSDEIPPEDTSGTSVTYQISVSDGHVRDTTPTYDVPTSSELAGGTVSGQLWYENDEDGVRSASEPLARGVQVALKLPDTGPLGGTTGDVTVTTVKTGKRGRFTFRNLPPGTYRVVPECPPGSEPVGPKSKTVTVDALQAVGGVDFAFRPTDVDGDGVLDVIELRVGLDPAAGADSDGDGISDYDEITKLGVLRPDRADTDGDGTGDKQEDLDSDGLTNGAELAFGSNPLDADEDGDHLDDSQEQLHRTQPAVADTDADGLPDGFELDAGTDPLKADTDGDGTLDGAETLTSSTRQEGASVELTGHGPLADHLHVASLDAAGLPPGPGALGPIREVHLDDAYLDGFDTAKITLPYDPATVSDPANLEVFAYKEDIGMWVPASSTQRVDSANHTVTATVDHFSLYQVFDRVEWEQAYAMNGLSFQPLDVMFVIDSSGSMLDMDPFDDRLTASRDLTLKMLQGDRSGLVDFDDTGHLDVPLSEDHQATAEMLMTINAEGGTDIGAGIRTALEHYEAVPGDNHRRTIMLITDGIGTYDPALTQRAVDDKVAIYAIDLKGGTQPDAVMKSMAEDSGGKYYRFADVGGDYNPLMDDFWNLNGDDDSDGDHIADGAETQGIRDAATGELVQTNPLDRDTDGDGISDGDEVGFVSSAGITGYGDTAVLTGDKLVLQMVSDPRTGDTDKDYLFDGEELGLGSDPRLADADGDKVLDGEEARENTEPSSADSDGDGRDDRYELDRLDDGLDPMVAEDVKTKLAYINDFSCGFIAGEFNTLWPGCEDSIPWLAGDIASGVVVVGDIRDALGSAIKGDVVGVGLSLVSLVPYAGDSLNAGVKISRFLTRIQPITGPFAFMSLTAVTGVTSGADDVSGEVFKILKGADGARESVIEALRRWDPQLLADLQTHMSDDVIEALVTSGQSARLLQDLFATATVEANKVGFFDDWRKGEDWLRADTRGVKWFFKWDDSSGTKRRFVDAYDESSFIAHEAKVGKQTNRSRLRDELDKDCALLADADSGVDAVIWHFYGSKTKSGKYRLGPDRGLLDELKSRISNCDGLKIKVYPPSAA